MVAVAEAVSKQSTRLPRARRSASPTGCSTCPDTSCRHQSLRSSDCRLATWSRPKSRSSCSATSVICPCAMPCRTQQTWILNRSTAIGYLCFVHFNPSECCILIESGHCQSLWRSRISYCLGLYLASFFLGLNDKGQIVGNSQAKKGPPRHSCILKCRSEMPVIVDF
jgi:hypothetical protein